MKTCRICNLPKEPGEFPRNKGNRDGMDSRCKLCRVGVYKANRDQVLREAKARYDLNPESFRTRRRKSHAAHAALSNSRRRIRWDDSSRVAQNASRHRVKTLCFEALGGRCAVCRVDDLAVLCVDHVNDDGGEERASGVASITVWRKVARGEESGRYQALCFNCNLRKSVVRDRLGPLSGISKKCATCAKHLDGAHFKADAKYADGRYYECRACSRDRVVAVKAVALSRIGSCRCVQCGCSDILTMTVDHVGDDGSSSRAEDGLGETLYRRLASGTLDVSRFQPLCLNCNIKKHTDLVGSRSHVAGFGSLKPVTSVPASVRLPAPLEELISFSFEDAMVSASNSIPECVEFFETWHYAGYGRHGSILVQCRVGESLAAIAKFASPVRQEVASSAGLRYCETLELDRFCIRPSFQKKNFASFFLSRACKEVRRARPDVTALVSFADPEHGHTGTIYKAANWEECQGSQRASYIYRAQDGKIVHKKTVYDSAKSRGETEARYALGAGLEKIPVLAKKKFLYRF